MVTTNNVRDLRELNYVYKVGNNSGSGNYGSAYFIDGPMLANSYDNGKLDLKAFKRIMEKAERQNSIYLNDSNDPYLLDIFGKIGREKEPLIEMFGNSLSVLDATAQAVRRGISVEIPLEYILRCPIWNSDCSIVEKLKDCYQMTPTWRMVGKVLELYPIFQQCEKNN